MKKQIFYLASAALVAGLAACSNDELDGNYGLDSNEEGFTATIEQAETDGDASTRVKVTDTALSWVASDQIGMYNTGEENYAYQIKEKNLTAKKFTPVDKQKTLTAATYAYYPFYEGAGDITMVYNIKANLDGAYNNSATYDENSTTDYKGATVWTDGVVKMPMAATVNGSSINFKNTTALVKITVVNMPTTAVAATLTSNVAGLNLTGPAVMNLKDQTLKVGTDETANGNTITYVAKNAKTLAAFQSESGKTQTFYFIVPEGTYKNTGEGAAKGLTFALASALGATVDKNTNIDTWETDLNSAVKGHLYEKTIYCNGTKFVDGVVQQLNEDLTDAADNATVEADWGTGESATTFAASTIYIPSAANANTQKESVTINLYNVGAAKLTFVAGGDFTPKKVIINSSLAANVESAGQYDIQLPKSSVELGIAPAKEEEKAESKAAATYALTLNSVDFQTAPNVLRIKEGVAVTTLTRTSTSASGNVFVEKNASVAGCTDAAYYIFQEDSETSKVATSASTSVKVVAEEIYNLIYPTDTKKTNKLTAKCDLLDEITIKVSGVTLDLNGFALTAATGKSAIVVEDGGSIEISDSSEKKEGKVQGVDGKPVINIKDGGAVTLASGNVTADESDKSFDVVGGSLTVKGGKASGAIEATVGGQISVTGGTIVDAATVGGKSEASVASKLTISGGKVASVVVKASGAVEVKGGEVSGGIADAASNAGTIAISAGKVTGETALTLAGGSKATITGGTIAGTETAVSITAGELLVDGDGTPTFTGKNVIDATPAQDAALDDVKVTLDAENAEYVASANVIQNHASTGSTSAVTLAVKKGYFTGEVVSDETNYFIAGGYFKNCNTLEQADASKYFVSGYKLSTSTNDKGYYSVVKK